MLTPPLKTDAAIPHGREGRLPVPHRPLQGPPNPRIVDSVDNLAAFVDTHQVEI